MGKWDELADDKSIERTVAALKANGIDVFVVKDGEEAKERVLDILPKGAEVMGMSSTTLDTINLSKELSESGKFDSVRKKLMSMNRDTQGSEMRK